MKLIKHSFFFILGAALIFLGAELCLFTVSNTGWGKILPLTEPLLGRPDPDIGYAFKPSAKGLWTRENRAYIQINSLGFRDHETSIKKPADFYRVALMGDSITEALQVENERTYENLAEQALRSKGYKIEILNLAMSGNGPLRQLVRLEKFGLSLKPNLAVFVFSISDFLTGEIFNDLESPAYRYDEHQKLIRSYAFRNRLSQHLANTILGKTFFFIIEYSHVLRAVNLKSDESFLNLMGIKLPAFGLFQKNSNQVQADLLCSQMQYRQDHDLWMRHEPKEAWDGVEKFTQELQVLVHTHPTKILIAGRVPLADRNCPGDQEYRQALISKIKSHFKNHDISFVDWNQKVASTLHHGPYQNAAMNELSGFGLDLTQGHLNYHGHRVFAQTLEDVLMPYIRR